MRDDGLHARTSQNYPRVVSAAVPEMSPHGMRGDQHRMPLRFCAARQGEDRPVSDWTTDAQVIADAQVVADLEAIYRKTGGVTPKLREAYEFYRKHYPPTPEARDAAERIVREHRYLLRTSTPAGLTSAIATELLASREAGRQAGLEEERTSLNWIETLCDAVEDIHEEHDIKRTPFMNDPGYFINAARAWVAKRRLASPAPSTNTQEETGD